MKPLLLQIAWNGSVLNSQKISSLAGRRFCRGPVQKRTTAITRANYEPKQTTVNATEQHLMEAQILALETKAQIKASEIPDSDVVHLGRAVFLVRGKYHVDMRSPRPYAICSCKAWALTNPVRIRQLGYSVRCKHVLKVEEMYRCKCFQEPSSTSHPKTSS